MEVFIIVAASALFIVPAIFIAMTSKNAKAQANSAKNAPPFESRLSQTEILDAVAERLKNIQSIRNKWSITDRVDNVGRLQARLNIPYNLSGDNIKISFLVNLLAMKKAPSGCMVEWSYVMMSPINKTPPEIELWEQEIYKNTTLEIRAAIFSAQDDHEVADFLMSQTNSQLNEPRKSSLFDEESHVRTAPKPEVENADRQPKSTPGVEKTPGAGEVTEVSTPDKTAVVNEVTEVSNPEKTADVNEIADVSSEQNPLNFQPPALTITPSHTAANGDTCGNCNQTKDPNFSFCLYCGHTETKV